MTDQERLDWLEQQPGAALVNDDNGHWAVAYDGFQNVPVGDQPQDISTAFYIEKSRWHNSIREAIDAAIKEQSE